MVGPVGFEPFRLEILYHEGFLANLEGFVKSIGALRK